MELGNLLFGHSRGEYELNRGSAACDLLGDIGPQCGLDGWSRLDEDVAVRMDEAGFTPDWLVETPRGVDLHHPMTGVLLARTRAYWWDGDDAVQTALPNLEIPALELEIRWYKHAFRDAYANQPFTFAVAKQIAGIMEPVMALMRPYTPHPVRYPLDWTRDGEDDADSTLWECRMHDPTAGDPMYSHGTIVLNEDARDPYDVEMLSCDGAFAYHGMFPTLEDARDWCARQCVEWKVGE